MIQDLTSSPDRMSAHVGDDLIAAGERAPQGRQLEGRRSIGVNCVRVDAFMKVAN